MKFWKSFSSKRITYAVVLLLLFGTSAFPQSLTLEIEDIRTIAHPFLSFKAILLNDEVPLLGTDSASFNLTENGKPVDFKVFCPDKYNYNSIALVLDNSTHLRNSFSRIDSLKIATTNFLDSLKSEDECMIATFDNGGSVAVGFTTDKTVLKNYISGLNISSGTPLYKSIMIALHELAKRKGRKVCVVMNEGPDTNPGGMPEKVLNFARENEINIYTLSWELFPGRYDRLLEILPQATGGKYYLFGKNGCASLSDMFEKVRSDITSPYCTIVYTADGCRDSIRVLDLTATVGNRSTSTTAIVNTPFRPDTIHITVQADVDMVVPPDMFNVVLRLEPWVSTDMFLSFSFLIKYNSRMIRFRLPPHVLGTIVSQGLYFQNRRLGVWECGLSFGDAVKAEGDLFGWEFATWVSDTSRPVIITIDSVVFENGCPNIVVVHPDTVFVCACERNLDVAIQGNPVITEEEIRLPIVLTDSLIFGKSLFTLHMHYDNTIFEPIGVDGINAITENATLSWRIKNEDTLEISTNEQFEPAPGRVLCYARFRVKQPKAAESSRMSLPSIRAFSDCCYKINSPDTTAYLIDGLCDKVVRRKADFTLAQNHPNPAKEQTQFRFTVHEKHGFTESNATLSLYRSDGTIVGELFEGVVNEGEYSIPYLLNNLSTGTYYYVLSMNGNAQTRSLVVVK